MMIDINTLQGDTNHNNHQDNWIFNKLKAKSTNRVEIDLSQHEIQPNFQEPNHRLLEATSIKTYEDFLYCISEPEVMHPCWGAHVVKNYPVELDW